MQKLSELPLEDRAVYVSIHCIKDTFIFVMLVGQRRFQLVYKGSEKIDLTQDMLNHIGGTYTGFKFELLQLAQFLNARVGDMLDDKYNVSLGGRYYIKGSSP